MKFVIDRGRPTEHKMLIKYSLNKQYVLKILHQKSKTHNLKTIIGEETKNV